MHSKWKFSVFLLVLFVVFGALKEQTTLPNQEIVLELIDKKLDDQHQENTIAFITKKLHDLGISNINIKDSGKGTLIISYFSSTSVDELKELITSNDTILVGNNSEKDQNKEDSRSKYNINIYEIQDVIDVSTSDDNCIIETELNFDRSTPTSSFASLKASQLHKEYFFFKSKSRAFHKALLYARSTSNGQPEVRAGPYFV